MKYLVRLHGRDEDGVIFDMNQDYDIEDLGGVIPVVGDKIVSPWVAGQSDRNLPENRTVHLVTDRYLLPENRTRDFCYVAIVVEPSPGTPEDQALSCHT